MSSAENVAKAAENGFTVSEFFIALFLKNNCLDVEQSHIPSVI